MTFQPPSMSNQEAAQRYFADAPALYVPQPVPSSDSAVSPVVGITPGTSPWWIDRLTTAMARREPRLTRLRSYFRGEQDTWRLSNQAFRTTFGRAFWGMKSNLMLMVVLAAAHRLRVTGFDLPSESPFDPNATPPGELPEIPDQTDTEAWRIWQANDLDSGSSLAHVEALASGECPVLVQPNPDDPKTPRVTIEDPLQVIVERDPADPRKRLAALKRFPDTDGSIVHILYLPDRIEWWRQYPTTSPGGERWGWVAPTKGGALAFQLRGRHFELDAEKSGANVLGEVPVVVLVNNPRLDWSGQAEHEAVIPLQDVYNKTLMDMMVTSEFSAHRQRWAVGVALDEEANAEDSSGNVTQTPTSPMMAAADRVWTTENPDAKFGEFNEANLEPYTSAMGTIRGDVSSITFTPYHYLLGSPTSVPPTGESLKSAETPLVEKIKAKHPHLGSGWREVIRLVFRTAGDATRATAVYNVRWQNPESRIISVLADALVKLGSIGVPEPALWAEWGFSSDEIRLFTAMRAASAPPEAPVRVTLPATSPAEVSQVADGTEAMPAAPIITVPKAA